MENLRLAGLRPGRLAGAGVAAAGKEKERVAWRVRAGCGAAVGLLGGDYYREHAGAYVGSYYGAYFSEDDFVCLGEAGGEAVGEGVGFV